jgi:hypothetical protein
MSFKVNKFSPKCGGTHPNNNTSQNYYPVVCYSTTAICQTVEVYVYLLMKNEKVTKCHNIMDDYPNNAILFTVK